MSAPLGPAGLAALIAFSAAAVGFLVVLGGRATKASDQDGEPLTAEEQDALDQLERRFQEPR